MANDHRFLFLFKRLMCDSFFDTLLLSNNGLISRMVDTKQRINVCKLTKIKILNLRMFLTVDVLMCDSVFYMYYFLTKLWFYKAVRQAYVHSRKIRQ